MPRIARIVLPGYPRHVTQRGHLWQGRFGSHVMDEAHLLAAARYVDPFLLTG